MADYNTENAALVARVEFLTLAERRKHQFANAKSDMDDWQKTAQELERARHLLRVHSQSPESVRQHIDP